MQQANTLRGPPGSTDGLGINADDLAVLADDHQFRGFIDQQDRAYFPVASSRLHINDAPATTGLQTIFIYVGAFAVALLGNGKNQRGRASPISVLLTFAWSRG